MSLPLPQLQTLWIQQHPIVTEWVLSLAWFLILYLVARIGNEIIETMKTALADIATLKDVMTRQAENHLTHIEANTLEMSNTLRDVGTKLDVLITVMEKK